MKKESGVTLHQRITRNNKHTSEREIQRKKKRGREEREKEKSVS